MTGAEQNETAWGRISRELAAINDATRSRQFVAAALAEKLERRSRQLRISDPDLALKGEQLQLLAFASAREQYAIPVGEIAEVQSLDQLSPVPGAPAFIRGVVQHRGTLLALLDLGRLFGLREEGLSDVQFYAIVLAAGRRVAVAIGELEDILTVPVSEIRDCSALRGDLPVGWVAGLYRESRLILRMEAILSDSRLTDWRGGLRPGAARPNFGDAS